MSNMRDAFGLRVPYGKATSQYLTEFDPATRTVWGYFKPKGTPCFSLGLLKDIRAHDEALAANGGKVEVGGELQQANYYVCGSRTPRVFNLGGDLALFVLLIKARDRDALAHYARLCIDNMYPRIRNYFCPTLTTISLVQGDALGGGFESALSSNVLVAEESAQMGLPEILFNLFPGMGAYSLLGRRVGAKRAEEMILSGRIYTATELYQLGVVDIMVEDGAGEAAVQDYVRGNARRRNGTQAVFRCRQHFNPISYDELMNITKIWVEAALRLDERDLKLMNRLVRAQLKRVQNTPHECTREDEAAVAA